MFLESIWGGYTWINDILIQPSCTATTPENLRSKLLRYAGIPVEPIYTSIIPPNLVKYARSSGPTTAAAGFIWGSYGTKRKTLMSLDLAGSVEHVPGTH